MLFVQTAKGNIYYHYLHTLLETSSDAVAIINREKKVEFWNAQAESVYGIAKEAIIGREIEDFFRKQDLKLLEILATEEAVTDVHHQPRPDKHVLINSSPIYNDSGELIGAISIEDDVTNEVKLNEKLSLTTTELQKMKHQVNRHQQSAPFYNIKGESAAIQRAKQLSAKVAKTDATVLIQGESGVGKELFSQGIHEGSPRSKAAFVPINCGAIPDTLFESELFGYGKGAFTGADKGGKKGKIELAGGGTLFLDEIGSLPLDMQVKLLRVLQEKEVFPIGADKAKKVDVRVVAATNSDLRDMVKEGTFRADLYYRLNVVVIDVPPLRNRLEDIPVIADHFMQDFALKHQKQIPHLLSSTLHLLQGYGWPGNVRELRNIIERMILFHDKETIGPDDISEILPPDFGQTKEIPGTGLLYEDRAKMEKERIIITLEETYGNKSAAAKLLGISRVSLYKKMKQYEIPL
jgi:PAS domain S-box-containing protein